MPQQGGINKQLKLVNRIMCKLNGSKEEKNVSVSLNGIEHMKNIFSGYREGRKTGGHQGQDAASCKRKKKMDLSLNIWVEFIFFPFAFACLFIHLFFVCFCLYSED